MKKTKNEKNTENLETLREETVRFVRAIQTPQYLINIRDIAIMYVNKEQCAQE